MEMIKKLRERTGRSLNDCNKALELCNNDINVAYEYLRLREQALARYKIVNGKKIPWQTEDYLEAAKKNIQD
jgi:translation elongation factor EF-Ts